MGQVFVRYLIAGFGFMTAVSIAAGVFLFIGRIVSDIEYSKAKRERHKRFLEKQKKEAGDGH